MNPKPLEIEDLFSKYSDAFTKVSNSDDENHSERTKESLEKEIQEVNLKHVLLRTSLTEKAYDHVVHIVVFSLVIYGLIIFFDMFVPYIEIDDTKFVAISSAVIVQIVGLLLVIVKGLFK